MQDKNIVTETQKVNQESLKKRLDAYAALIRKNKNNGGKKDA